MSDEKTREKVIIHTSLTGIIANLFLVGFKMAVGFVSGSIAVILDAINNLSDALSSIITIIGIRLAAKKPDAKHPMGYGRVEYLSALIVSALVLYAGITSLIESIKKIIHPDAVDYSLVSLIIIGAAVIVKFLLGRYVSAQGKKADSAALVASGSDASFDALVSLSVLISALLYVTTHIAIEAWVGAAIAILIIKSGLEMLQGTLDDILGMSIDKNMAHAIKQYVRTLDPAIHGAHDLILHNYGPSHFVGSIHISIPDTMNAEQIDSLTRKITDAVYQKFGVLLVGVGIYSCNTKDDAAAKMRQQVQQILSDHEGFMQMHGFYVDEQKKYCSFDMILNWNVPDRQALYEHMKKDVENAFPDYTFRITLDLDI
ncbi:cation diffusion facilitator family transporter [Stecheria sp. CLA-KB-P133]|uniref:Cation diffusion facilitator family transporter n=1 Tax=Grylomicrobium aquisgranensis TaxID=2926318 RepID=A0AB35U1N7_9FIRM|nr:cation diffusion facilitator family transporter [Lactimicrobium massiliense]MDX8419323.1 cation diffusion facilitator family transporter [Stecheria sp. CLA-KB-P133]